MEIIRSYFIDVIRYKEYHFSADDKTDPVTGKAIQIDPFSERWIDEVHEKLINESKVAAYTAKWILAYKPLTIISDASLDLNGAENPQHIQTKLYANINEVYALNCALSVLKVDYDDVPENRIDELIYNFRFRKFEEGLYFMILSRSYLLSEEDSR